MPIIVRSRRKKFGGRLKTAALSVSVFTAAAEDDDGQK